MKSYKTAVSKTLVELEVAVNDLIELGYTPVGGVVINVLSNVGHTFYIQAMFFRVIKDE